MKRKEKMIECRKYNISKGTNIKYYQRYQENKTIKKLFENYDYVNLKIVIGILDSLKKSF